MSSESSTGTLHDVSVTPIRGVSLRFGESVRWDDRRQRLYCVDCIARCVHWLDGGAAPMATLQLPSSPTGLVLTEGDAVVVVLEDGLYTVEPDTASVTLLAPYPDEMQERCNDARADLEGNLLTGSLLAKAGSGSYWQYSSSSGWRLLDRGISNANGPVALVQGGESLLVFGDTTAGVYYQYRYDASEATATDRRVYADVAASGGGPDGAIADANGQVWCALFGGAALARLDGAGYEAIPLPVSHPTDVAFGGENLDVLYVSSVGLDLGAGKAISELDGSILAVSGLGVRGRPEPRMRLIGASARGPARARN